MNKNKYLITRLVLHFIGFIPSTLFIFFPVRNKNSIIFSSQFNTTFEHNSKSLFLHMIEDKNNDLEIYYVINDDTLRRKLNRKYGDYFISTSSVLGLFKVLLAHTWITSSLETPVGGVGLSIKRNVIHLGHGSPIKKVGLGVNSNSILRRLYYHLLKSNFSYFLSTSKEFDDAWAGCLGFNSNRVVRAPQARNDRIVKSQATPFNNDYYSILYAPTWRPGSDIELFPFTDFNIELLESFLNENNIHIYLRVHPNFLQSLAPSLVHHSNIFILSNDEVEDINEVLGSFDLLITDYSSIYFDYLLTLKPIIFLPYDQDNYEQVVGFTIPYEKLSPGPKPSTFLDFIHEVEHFHNNNDEYYSQREEVNDLVNPTKSEHAQSCASIVRELIKV
ncbi:CDP-glycerol glycerophosphotransferase family protein [Vibrio sp. 1CM24A]|uniref:CDP-glycerol glycerophosphotransferase family protein n=1 Tax=Vibrio sp. 1CM24A TaxID=2929165 RepID=UPI0020C091F4|nr:CDP-glycerol glycerophosphotransferase family protein [Vibrio sp. 1CM24A]MCK8083478.1 CDP-glycerol glycerophosphotransferase family protein [Vibrio sp. 1CM24A]